MPSVLLNKEGRWTTGSLAKVKSEAEYDFLMSTVPKKIADAYTLADFGYQYITIPSSSSAADAKAQSVPPEGGAKADADRRRTVLRTMKDPTVGFQWLGQKHYDFLGNAIVNEIYSRMESNYSLCRVMVPLTAAEDKALEKGLGVGEVKGSTAQESKAESSNVGEGAPTEAPPPSGETVTSAAARKAPRREPQVPIFMSKDALTCDTLLVIMQGTGAVRPGMWARALCMNESLEAGTVFSYIDRARANGWGVVVTNPNENTVPVMDIVSTGSPSSSAAACQSTDAVNSSESFWLGVSDSEWKSTAKRMTASSEHVRGSQTAQQHSQYVFKTFVMKSAARRVLIVAHSYGGICVGSLLRDQPATIGAFVRSRCPAIAFTDACNDVTPKDSDAVRSFYKNNVVNWVASRRPLNKKEGIHRLSGCEERSAGHEAHEWTSACALVPVFEWLEEKLAASAKPKKA